MIYKLVITYVDINRLYLITKVLKEWQPKADVDLLHVKLTYTTIPLLNKVKSGYINIENKQQFDFWLIYNYVLYLIRGLEALTRIFFFLKFAVITIGLCAKRVWPGNKMK